MTTDSIRPWLESLGRFDDYRLQSISGGGNNLAGRVEFPAETLFLKVYRDRPRAEREFAFLTFLVKHGLTQVPQPVALHPHQPWALHQFVAARKPTALDLPDGLTEARAFLRHLKDLPHEEVPLAVDAFVDYPGHLELVRARIAQLGAEQLVPRWEAVRQLPWPEPPAAADFWVSPSDFGFHNALVVDDGSFCFVDFEYAGVDDSAKLVCDFYCQPQLPAPLESWPDFLELLSPGARRRLSWMWQVTTLKWACIILKRQPDLDWLWQRRAQVLELIRNEPGRLRA